MAEKMNKTRAIFLLGQLLKKKREQALLIEARDQRLKPLTDKYKKACEPINKECAETLSTLATEIATSEKEVSDFLKLGFDALKGTASLSSIESEPHEGKALMAVVNVRSERAIPAEAFFKKVTERTAEFWATISVSIAAAKKLVGEKTVNELAVKTHTASVSFQLIDSKAEPAQVPKAKAAKGK